LFTVAADINTGLMLCGNHVLYGHLDPSCQIGRVERLASFSLDQEITSGLLPW
jgi:hypothetical protein